MAKFIEVVGELYAGKKLNRHFYQPTTRMYFVDEDLVMEAYKGRPRSWVLDSGDLLADDWYIPEDQSKAA